MAKLLKLADVRKVAKQYGAAVDEQHSGNSGRYFNIAVDLPRGRTWQANGCHSVYSNTAQGDPKWISEACADAIQQMEYGINEPEPDGTCGDPNCDICNPEGD